MPNEPTLPADAPRMRGLDMLLNMTDLDRAQEVWERAMSPEAHAYIRKLAVFNAGRGPNPGMYEGPVVDFLKARRELDEERPERKDE